MSKGQHGNKEAKKPKKAVPTAAPLVSPGAVRPTITTVVPDRSKKK